MFLFLSYICRKDKIFPCFLPRFCYIPIYSNIDGIDGFSEEDSHSVFDFMQLTLKMARSDDGPIVNAAVIVDPSVNQIIASACDKTCSLYSSKAESCIRNCTKQPEVYGSHPDSSVVADHWAAQQKLQTTSSSWHPLRHASIVAIESSAARDRRLFLSLGQDGEKSNGVDSIESSSTSTTLTKRQKTDSTNVS
ncbi:hypothetical protein Dsin_005728 [Dipteronia sinensis]|uniref:Uncharacterized protein n=1 Tax=Dipteronia sinensis TaxID=43782 RepID=A0AAE0AX21_9ROSI|nr:hypothetical protein Dsin_005728 [Dipteronia sinensis]